MQAPTTFAEAISRAPMRTFQWVIVAVCMLVLVSDGIDMQLLGIVAPLVIADFGVDRGTFGVAMSAALVGFGLGAWGGGWLGDLIGRRYTLAIAAFIFALATVAASQADGVWHMAGWRILGGLGFGAAYSNALAMAGEWLPERLRPVVISTLSVGTPIGGAVVGWIGPGLAEAYGWRGAFVIIGVTTLLLVLIILATLRDSPSFLLSRGKTEEAERSARRLLGEEIVLVPERHDTDGEGGASIGVLHRTNLRLNIGVGMAFAACALCAYAVLNWATTFLTAAGFTLEQAGRTVAVVGITSMVGSVLAGILTRQFGSRFTMGLISAALVILMTALGFVIETLPAAPTEQDLLLVMILSGVSAAFFSGGIAVMYVVMTFGYPQSCRTAGIGFGIFMSRVGAISASGLGGAVLDFGQGSVIPFFAILAISALLVGVAIFIIDRHVPPLRAPAVR